MRAQWAVGGPPEAGGDGLSLSPMNKLTEATLRRQLQEFIIEPFHIVQIQEFKTEFDADGDALPHCYSYRRLFEDRLARLRELVPNRADIHDEHAAVLQALEVIRPSERLFHWIARSHKREYFGAATMRCIVSCFSYSRPSDLHKSMA